MSTREETIEASALAEWARKKLREAEKAVTYREQAESLLRDGKEEEWAKAARWAGMKPSSESERIEEAESHKRIATKCRVEVAMWKAALAVIESSNAAQRED